MAKCRGCGAPIVWLQSKNGKMIPCNPLPVGYRERAGAKGKVVTRDGLVVSCDFTNEPEQPTGYIPHFATCPKAADFKKRNVNMTDYQDLEKRLRLYGWNGNMYELAADAIKTLMTEIERLSCT